MPVGTGNKSHDETGGNMLGNIHSSQPKPLVVLASNWMVSNGLLSQDQALGWAKSVQQQEAADAIDRLFAEYDHEYEDFVLAQEGIVRIGTGRGNRPRSDHTDDAHDDISDVLYSDRSMDRPGGLSGLDLLASSFASDAAASLTSEEWEAVFQGFKSKYSEEIGGADTYVYVRPDDIPCYQRKWNAPALRADTRKVLDMLMSLGLQELNHMAVMKHPATDLVLKQTGLGIAKLVLRVMRAEVQVTRLVVLYYIEKLESEAAKQDAILFAKHFNLGHYMDIYRFEIAARSRHV
jgi:hypothetical protein